MTLKKDRLIVADGAWLHQYISDFRVKVAIMEVFLAIPALERRLIRELSPMIKDDRTNPGNAGNATSAQFETKDGIETRRLIRVNGNLADCPGALRWALAHEFAHMALRHTDYIMPLCRACVKLRHIFIELEANYLCNVWGFPRQDKGIEDCLPEWGKAPDELPFQWSAKDDLPNMCGHV